MGSEMCIRDRPKSRKHFHAFMNEIHEEVNFFRKRRHKEPVKKAAEKIFKKTKFLCLDEFQINDITDAMIVGRLFEYFFDMGIFVFITSNSPPDELYKNGINRDLFLPFIEIIKKKTEVKVLDSKTDYRKLTLKGKKVCIPSKTFKLIVFLLKIVPHSLFPFFSKRLAPGRYDKI